MPAFRVVEAALAKYLTSRIVGSSELTVSNLFRIPGGASRETWMFDATWSEPGHQSSGAFVLRKDPPASLLTTERELEYAFYEAFENSDVPVPRMRWLENGSDDLGAPFFIMDRILGCDSNTTRIQAPEYVPVRDNLAKQMYEILASIHRFDWRGTGIEKVTPVPAPDECWKHELDHWEQVINENELSPQPVIRAGIRWLRANPPPPPDRITVVHADYRVGNFLYTPQGIHGIVDWEMAHLGDPIEDIAWSFMEAWEWTRDGRKGGIIWAEDAIRIYEEATGTRVNREALHWWDVFGSVKGQAIWLTGARSFHDGKTAELIIPFTSYWLINFQDEIMLRALGRGA